MPWFWSDQYDLTLQIAGLADSARPTVERGSTAAVISLSSRHERRLVAASGIGPDGAIAKDIRLAEMLIGNEATPDPVALADRKVSLKGLLRS